MSSQSSRLGLPYLLEAQAQKHVTVNEALRRLDALIDLRVLSATRTTQPASVAESDAYLLPGTISGADWDNFTGGHIAVFQDGAWVSYTPFSGMTAYTEDQGIAYVFKSGTWLPLNEPPQFGINTSPDTTNRFAVKSDAVLMSHDDVTPGSGDIRLVLNKSGSGQTASLVFQSGFTGRAEFGLAGSNNFSIRVADSAGTFRDAIVIDSATGAVSFPNTP
ncbi:MAG: DUF2793 domain-containing protein [Pseudomonadota bacterium]